MMLRVLSDAQLTKLHDASLAILAKVGVELPHTEVQRRFQEAGANVDDATRRVRIPESLVEESLAQAGKSFAIYGRDIARKAVFGKRERNYQSIAGEALWIDDTTGERRYASVEDAGTAARLADALPNLTIAGAMSDAHELSPQYGAAAAMAELLRNTTKPLGIWFHNRTVSRAICEMMVAVRGSEEEARRYPLAYPFLEPISPLRFPFDGVDALFETARLSLPIPIGPMCQVGMSGPATLSGTLAIENAEILAGVCISQLINPGVAVCYGGICHAFDMRTTQMIFAGPEQALMAVAATQLGKRYKLPVYVNVGLTDSKTPDAQAGLEVGVTLACGAMAGADIFGHMGICGVDQASSLDMLVVQHEAIGYTERLMEGIGVSDEAIGLDVIEAVGPGGTFVDQDHTADYFRTEVWFPKLLDRQYYDAWLAEGARTMAQRCRKEKERLLLENQPEPLPEQLDRELEGILAGVRKDLEAQGKDWRA
jgi:trimethylamine--corrinoid protein Co-methyltransferase